MKTLPVVVGGFLGKISQAVNLEQLGRLLELIECGLLEVRILYAGYGFCSDCEEARRVEKALADEAVKGDHLSRCYLFLQDIHDQNFGTANQVDSEAVFFGRMSVQLAGILGSYFVGEKFGPFPVVIAR